VAALPGEVLRFPIGFVASSLLGTLFNIKKNAACEGDKLTLNEVLRAVQDRIDQSAVGVAEVKLGDSFDLLTAIEENLRKADEAARRGDQLLADEQVAQALVDLATIDSDLKDAIGELSGATSNAGRRIDDLPPIDLLVDLGELRVAMMTLRYHLTTDDRTRAALKPSLGAAVRSLSQTRDRHDRQLGELVDPGRFEVVITRSNAGYSSAFVDWSFRLTTGEEVESGTDRCTFDPNISPDFRWNDCHANLLEARRRGQLHAMVGAYAAEITPEFAPLVSHFEDEKLVPLRAWIGSGQEADFPVFPPLPEGAIQLVGDFDGDGVEETFHYNPGAKDDEHVTLSGDGSQHKFEVDLDYAPYLADLNGDGISDIVFYDPGPQEDMIWIANGEGEFEVLEHTLTEEDAQGFSGDFNGDGAPDSFFYADGEDSKAWFLFGESGALHVQAAGPNFQPLVGDFNGDGLSDVFFYAPGNAPDALWAVARR
jgi:hypothetical protein